MPYFGQRDDINRDSRQAALQRRVLDGVESLLERANYERIDPRDVTLILTRDSHYGLDFTVDMHAFEDILIYYRGASNQKYERRRLSKFMRKEEFEEITRLQDDIKKIENPQEEEDEEEGEEKK